MKTIHICHPTLSKQGPEVEASPGRVVRKKELVMDPATGICIQVLLMRPHGFLKDREEMYDLIFQVQNKGPEDLDSLKMTIHFGNPTVLRSGKAISIKMGMPVKSGLEMEFGKPSLYSNKNRWDPYTPTISRLFREGSYSMIPVNWSYSSGDIEKTVICVMSAEGMVGGRLVHFPLEEQVLTSPNKSFLGKLFGRRNKQKLPNFGLM